MKFLIQFVRENLNVFNFIYLFVFYFFGGGYILQLDICKYLFSVESHLYPLLFGRINICTFISWRRTCSIYLQKSFIEIIILITMSLLENRIDLLIP